MAEAEADRRAAARAVFDDLLRLARDEVSVSVFALEHDAIVRPSPFVEDLASAGLHSQARLVGAPASEFESDSEADSETDSETVKVIEAQPLNPHAPAHARGVDDGAGRHHRCERPASWAVVRHARTAIADRGYHG